MTFGLFLFSLAKEGAIVCYFFFRKKVTKKPRG